MRNFSQCQLGEIAHVVAGDPAPQDPVAFAPDGPLFVRMQDVGRHHLHKALSNSRDRLDFEWASQSGLRLFPKDSILIPKSGASVNLNHRAKLAAEAYVVSHLAIVIPDQDKVEPDYLYWWSVCYDPRAQVQVTSLPSLRLSTLRSATVSLPPLDEQRRIVGILNRAARIERLRTRALELLEEFIQALFVRMFGDPNENPKGWETYPFPELVSDGTRNCVKIKKRDYKTHGLVQIVDQGKPQIGGYSDKAEGAFHGPLPRVVFGDHTRRFKLIEESFFLGAEGVKLLEPLTDQLDPVFLFGQCQAFNIEDAGYSRHFRFLRMKDLCLPPIDLQNRYRNVVQLARAALSVAASGSRAVSELNASLMNRLTDVDE